MCFSPVEESGKTHFKRKTQGSIVDSEAAYYLKTVSESSVSRI